MKLAVLVLIVVSSCTFIFSQIQKPEPCDKSQTFCWYGPYADGSDEVDAWGSRWVAQDASEKALEASTHMRCVKRLGICIKASAHVVFGKTIVRADILPVTRWGSEQISADAETVDLEPCERDTFVINRVDRTVLMISSPGPQSDSKGCTGVLGKPKTVVYRLVDATN
jgi:hypothetical protein